ncbi:hypothetical protein OCU04_003220 [Sclerotinia nivalis]|uniref:Uncharacterized protein n=1 Tax=Sclerotinia nivalis TaxID=352851 RepID=A0A9X0ARG6_9HELO|nr:hypothetical protein OCU04_003220 [Sclerotinia nivalis]
MGKKSPPTYGIQRQSSSQRYYLDLLHNSLHTIGGYEDSEEQPPSYSCTDEVTSSTSVNSATNAQSLGAGHRSPPMTLIAANFELVSEIFLRICLLCMIWFESKLNTHRDTT